jgi:hypothetical protein
MDRWERVRGKECGGEERVGVKREREYERREGRKKREREKEKRERVFCMPSLEISRPNDLEPD